MKNKGGIDLSKDWLRMNVYGDGVCTITVSQYISESHIDSIYYSVNGNRWTKKNRKLSARINVSIPVVDGDIVYFKGIATQYEDSNSWSTRIACTANHTLSGNIMSLLYGNDFEGQTVLPSGERTFKSLFKEDTALTSCEDLKLPATTLRTSCYSELFYLCSNLAVPPKSLPASSLSGACYENMFDETVITTVPDMPIITSIGQKSMTAMFRATKVENASGVIINDTATQCCQYMFYNCKQLARGPQLLAETPASSCYGVMFTQCTNLRYVKCLLKTNTSAMSQWMQNAKNAVGGSLFVKHINATWTTSGASGVLSNWTIIYYDPEVDKYYLDKNKTEECDANGNGLGENLQYDAEIEYLESDGDAYINTKVYQISNLISYHFDFYFPGYTDNDAWMFGTRNGTNLGQNALNIRSGDVSWYYGNTTASSSPTLAAGRYTIYGRYQAIDIGDRTISNNGTSFKASYPFYIFALNNAGTVSTNRPPAGTKLYGGDIRGYGGSKFRDFIPVRVGSVGYLYDKVTQTLFGNANSTGAFILGADKTT